MSDGPTMLIREERPSDPLGIRAVNEAAFPTSAEADLVDQLRADGDAVVSLVAVVDDRVVGHVLFSRMQSPFVALALAPIAVLPALRRQGIAATLIDSGLQIAAASGGLGVFVLGDPAYYRRFGFRSEVAAGFTSPYTGPAFMGLSLGGGELPALHGELKHAPAFAALD